MYGAAGRLLFLRLATVGQRLGQAKTEIGQALNGLQNIGNVSAATGGWMCSSGTRNVFAVPRWRSIGKIQ